MIVVILLSISIALNAALLRICFRAFRRLLQFDDIFQGIMPVLDSYSKDLEEMSSADLDGILTDHPEILAFHRRNLAAKRDIESVVDSVTKMGPERREAPALPRPDME